MADPENRVTLAIGGKLYTGWTGIRITRAIDTLTGEFSLTLTDREFTDAARLDIRAGDACTVKVDDETLITGWIDRIDPSIDSQAHMLTVTGRDRAADLVDCSAEAKPGSWTNVSLEAIASQLAAPFGVTVTAKASTAPNIRRFALQQGETVQAAIERLCRYRGLLAVSTTEGNVELISPSQGKAEKVIVEGIRTKSLRATHDVSDRFSSYVVKGQSSGSDDLNGKQASGPSAKASDPAIKRHRPLILIGEEQSDIASLEKRAKWEATVRAGRAQEATIVMAGWREFGAVGPLWDRDTVVILVAPSLYMNGPMLITAVTLVKDEGGTVAELRMSPPQAWSQMAIPEDADASAVGKAA